MQHLLSPREIQSRIRAGASLQQVAADCGCDPGKIERFAYPVLMERSMMADRARTARPLVGGSPAKESVEVLVRRTLSERGQLTSVDWDSFRTETGTWLLRLTWNAGRSDNRAHWKFHPSAGGGTLVPVDDAAHEVVDPAPKPLRTVPEVEPEQEAAPAPETNPLATQVELPDMPPAPPARPAGRPAMGNKVAAALAQRAVTVPGAPSRANQATDPEPQARPAARTGTDGIGRRPRPPMPSWEDVLLGGQ